MALTSEKKPFFGLTGGWLTFWITVACATDMTLFGYDQGVFSGVIVTDDFLELHGLVGRTEVVSTVSAIYAVGCFFGAVIAFTVGERLGRKKSVLLGTSVMAVGAVLQAASYNLPMLFIGRTIAGLGNGINTATAPIWQTETSQAHWRGRLVYIETVMNIAGFSLVNWINYGMSHVGGAVAWRFPLAFQFVFIFILWGTTPWLPESPRWLVAHGRPDEARVILAALEAGGVVDDPFVETQLRDIQYSVNYEREHTVRWRDLFTKKGRETSELGGGDTKTLRRLLLGAGTQLMQQFGGINIMSYYLPSVFIEAVGLSNEMSRLLVACNSVSYLVFSAVAVTLVETWGRRTLLLLSTTGQLLGFLIICILLSLAASTGDQAKFGTASIAFFFLYYIAFGIGMQGVPWLYPTEINSLPMRTKGAALATCTNWITNFVIVEITPIGIQKLGWRFWIIFIITNAVFLPVIYFLYPETAYRTLEDLDDYYRSNPSLIVTKDPDATRAGRPQKYIDREEAKVAEVAEVARKKKLAAEGVKDGEAMHNE